MIITNGFIDFKKHIIYNDKRDAEKIVVLSTQIASGRFKVQKRRLKEMKKTSVIITLCVSMLFMCSCTPPANQGGEGSQTIERSAVPYEESTPEPHYSDTVETKGILEFRLHENGQEYAVTGYDYNADPMPTEIDIPSTFNGKPVTRICTDAFHIYGDFTKITISEGVTAIEEKAFWANSGLTEIYIPNSVTSIGESAFEKCIHLKTIKLPDTLTDIKNNTFNDCTALTSVSLPKNLKSIGQAAFKNCKSLTKIELPSSLEGIGSSAFSGTGLEKIEIPDLVSIIPNSCFFECNKLKYAVLPSSIKVIESHAFGDVNSEMVVEYHGTKAQFKSINPGNGYSNWIYNWQYYGPFIVKCTDGNLEYYYGY